MPEISVLMSVYNGEEHVSEAIDSLLAQTWQDFELLIIDDGSTDRTREIIQSYSDRRIRSFYFDENKGIGAALNYGLSHARGKYVAKADADDIHLPTRLEKQKKYLDHNPDIASVKTLFTYFPHDSLTEQTGRYKNMKLFREKLKNSVVTPDELHEKIYLTCCFAHTTIMARTAVLKKVGYDPAFRFAEDYKLFYELNKQGYKMGTVEEDLVRVRVSQTSITANIDMAFWQAVYIIKEQEIKQLFRGGNRVFLWGAGLKGKVVWEEILAKESLPVAGFIDSDRSKHNQTLAGLHVYPPDILKPGDKVLITSQPGLYDISGQLKQRGYAIVKDFIGFY